MVKKVFLFDVDGTLTPPREAMTQEFVEFFTTWALNKRVFLVSGSDYNKLKQQLPWSLLESIEGVFGCMGSTFHSAGYCLYRRSFQVPEELRSMLSEQLEQSNFPLRTGNHMEGRPGMLNFSIVGRNASREERRAYFEYDSTHKERERIAQAINDKYDNIDAAVGGEISIDIYPSGADKSQILSELPQSPFVFFGDRMAEGGNDYALAHVLQSNPDNTLHPVDSYEETWEILRKHYC